MAGGGVEDHGKLLIGERQLFDAIRLAQECDDAPHIIVGMAHHPFHLLQEFDRLPVQNRIERACQFFHCGHLHEPEARTTGYSGMGCLTIAAGASFETRQSHNTYSVVTLDLLRAVRTVKTIRYNPRNGAFSSGSAEEYGIEVRPGDTCSMGELADAMKTYRTALSPWAYYLSALLLDQKAELPIPVQHGHTLGSFSVLQTLPDSDLKRKTVVFMVFKNALRVLYKRVPLSDIFIQHGSAVAQYGTTLEELCGTDSALKDRLTAQQDDAQMLAGAEPTDSFFHTGALLAELADAHEWGLLREQAQRHLASPDPTVAIQARRMLALGLAHSDETADKEAAIKLYLSMTEDESAEISDFGILATLLIDARRMVEAKAVVFGGIAKFPANRADYFLQIGQRIVEATGDRIFREQMKAAIAERGRHA